MTQDNLETTDEGQDNRSLASAHIELTDDAKAALMVHIKRLAEVFDEHVTGKHQSQAYRVGGVNPLQHNTTNGLYLEFYYHGPSKVWTPWGEWHFAAAHPYQADVEGFMARLSLREHIARHNTFMGTIGPVYAILAIDGIELPEPLLPSDPQRLDYKDTKAEWDRFFGHE